MLMEVGYCIAKQIPIIVAARNDIGYTYLPEMGTASFRWNDLEDLDQRTASTDYAQLVS